MGIGVRFEDTSITFDGDAVTIVDMFGNDALKVESEDNGALSIVFLQKGNWGVGQKVFGTERKASIGLDYSTIRAVGEAIKPKYSLNDPDPHYYQSYNSRGYTIEESAERALGAVRYQIWDSYDYDQKGTFEDMRTLFQDMIAQGVGRDYIYRLAGRVKKIAYEPQSGELLQLLKDLAVVDGEYKA